MDVTLDGVFTDIQQRLTDAAGNRRSPMHTPVLATADADARVLVLRAFDPIEMELRFHTDARSPKVGVISEQPSVGVLFYDAAEKVQIRCRGLARIDSDSEQASSAWRGSTNYARRCYLGDPPGETRSAPDSGLPEWAEGSQPSEAELAPARENFAVLHVRIESVDWYCLSHEGHRRAMFLRDQFISRKGIWVTP